MSDQGVVGVLKLRSWWPSVAERLGARVDAVLIETLDRIDTLLEWSLALRATMNQHRSTCAAHQ